jgi:hypothetical protein
LQGNLTYQDQNSNRNFKSVEIISVVYSVNNTHARITGKGTINGTGNFQFVAEIDDLAEPGAGADRFAIRLSDGYSAGGTVTQGGNIQVHKAKK